MLTTTIHKRLIALVLNFALMTLVMYGAAIKVPVVDNGSFTSGLNKNWIASSVNIDKSRIAQDGDKKACEFYASVDTNYLSGDATELIIGDTYQIFFWSAQGTGTVNLLDGTSIALSADFTGDGSDTYYQQSFSFEATNTAMTIRFDSKDSILLDNVYLNVEATGSILTWDGMTSTDWAEASNWDRGIAPDATYNVQIPSAPANQPVISSSTSADCKSLTILSGASLTIESDASSSGSLIVAESSSGDVTYNRYMTGGSWHQISSPVVSQDLWDYATDANNSIAQNGTMRAITSYIESIDGWDAYLTASTGSNLISGTGYSTLRTANGTVSFTGTLQTGDISKTITRDSNGWNLIGNPYPSAINITQEADATNSLLNVTNISNLDPSYAVLYMWNGSSYTTIANGSTEYLQAGQAFIVRAPEGGSTFSITSAMRTHQPSASFRSRRSSDWSRIHLTATTRESESSTQISFHPNMTSSLDVSYDAGLYRSNPDIELYSRLVEDNGVNFDIQCLPKDSINEMQVPVGLYVNAEETVEFSINTEDFSAPVYLYDSYENTTTNLQEGSYIATVRSSGHDRFVLRFREAIATGTSETSINKIKVFYNNGMLHIQNPMDAFGTIRIYTTLGQELLNIPLNGETSKTVVTSLLDKHFIVHIQTALESKSIKIITH